MIHLIFAVLGVVSIPSSASPIDAVPGELLVRRRVMPAATAAGQNSRAAGEAAQRRIGARLIERFDSIGVDRIQLPPGMSMQQAMTELRNTDPEFIDAEPNYKVHVPKNHKTFLRGSLASLPRILLAPSMTPTPNNVWVGAAVTPSDPGFVSQWSLTKIEAPAAWNVTTGNSGIRVATIDSGAQLNHPDLAANMTPTTPNYDFVNGDSNPDDDDSHGTHVAGIIGAVGGNNTGIVGMNWQVQIHPYKVLDGEGSGTVANVIRGVEAAVAARIPIINMSLTLSGPSSALGDAIARASGQGILVVVAAGNDATNAIPYPASLGYTNMISVASTDSNDNLSSFSNFDFQKVQVAAPGTGILSTVPQSEFAVFNGTSMASPHVAGLAALILASGLETSAVGIRERILKTVDYKPSLSLTNSSGGRINARRALTPGIVTPNAPTLVVGAAQPKQFQLLRTSVSGWNSTSPSLVIDSSGRATGLSQGTGRVRAVDSSGGAESSEFPVIQPQTREMASGAFIPGTRLELIPGTSDAYRNAKLEIPATSLTQGRTIKFSEMLNAPEVPLGLEPASTAFIVEPVDLALSTPATLTIPYATGSDPNALVLYAYNTDLSRWEVIYDRIQVDPVNQTVGFRVSHFTFFRTGAAPANVQLGGGGGGGKKKFLGCGSLAFVPDQGGDDDGGASDHDGELLLAWGAWVALMGLAGWAGRKLGKEVPRPSEHPSAV